MKKVPLFLSFFISSISVLFSQDITFGVTGGINSSKIGILYHKGPSGGNGVTPSEDTYYTATSDMGYQVGGYFRINLNYFYVKPEVTYYSLQNSYELALNTSIWTQTGIDAGVYFGYNIIGPIYIYAGPTLTMISDRQLEGTQNTSYATWTYEKSNLGAGIGVSAQYGRFGLDARYLYGFTEVEELRIDMIRSSYGTNLADLQAYKPSRIVISATIDLFSFGGEKKKRGVKSDWRNHNNL